MENINSSVGVLNALDKPETADTYYVVQYTYAGLDQRFDERVKRLAKRNPLNSGYNNESNTRYVNYSFVTELGAKHFVRSVKRLRKTGLLCCYYPLATGQPLVIGSWKFAYDHYS